MAQRGSDAGFSNAVRPLKGKEKKRSLESSIMQRGTRKPGEPIYLRRHMVALALAVGLPIILLQLYKIYVGPISFAVQMGFGVLVSVLAGIGLYLIYRSSAQNQP
jgi:hypothetical protein